MAQQSPPKYSTILFDLYGTLVDIRTDENSEEAWNALRLALWHEGAHYGTNDQLRAQFQREMMRTNARRDRTDWFEPDVLPAYRELLRACWIDGTLEQARRVAWAFRQASTSHIQLFDGAKEVVQALKDDGKRVVLVSNAQAAYTRPEIEMFGLDTLFDNIVLLSDEGVRKPSGELFRHALIRENIDANQALMVGNDENSDIFGAVKAGIDAVYLHTDPNTGGPTAEQAVRSLQGADYQGLLDYVRGTEQTPTHA